MAFAGAGQASADAAADILVAADQGDAARIRQALLASAPRDPRDSAGRSPLLIAVERNHAEVAKVLIEADVDIKAQAAAMIGGSHSTLCATIRELYVRD